jgi:hypothetical protein
VCRPRPPRLRSQAAQHIFKVEHMLATLDELTTAIVEPASRI